MSHWTLLILAGICEIGWPLGYKFAQENEGVYQYAWLAFAISAGIMSAWLLWLAQKGIPIGTAYAAWTGIGAVGAFIFGIMLFGEHGSLIRWFGVSMIVGGVVLLKSAS